MDSVSDIGTSKKRLMLAVRLASACTSRDVRSAMYVVVALLLRDQLVTLFFSAVAVIYGTLAVLTLLYLWPTSREWIIAEGRALGEWASEELATNLKKDDKGKELVSTVKQAGISLLANYKRATAWWYAIDRVTAVVEGDRMIIPYILNDKRYELVVSYNAREANTAERPVVYEGDKRTAYPLHHPSTKFYLSNLLGEGSRVEWE